MADDPGERDAIEREVERALDRQRWTIDTARVVVVFAAGAAASVGAAAWQTLGSTHLTVASACLLGASILLMIFSFLFDERHLPDLENLIADAAQGGYSARDAIAAYNRAAVRLNETFVTTVVMVSTSQALTAFGAGVLAALAMLLEAR